MAKSTPAAAAKEKAKTMIAQPGQIFVAIKDCYIDRCIKEGESVSFAPGQSVPLNLVRLVEEPEPQAEANSTQGQQAGSDDAGQDKQTGGQGEDEGQEADPGDGAFTA